MNVTAWLLLFGVLAFGALVVFVIVPWRLRRAIKWLVNTFRELNATTPEKAITTEDLGIKPRFLEFRRDYRMWALNLLLKVEIIVPTEDKKFYFSEERFKQSKIYTPPTS